MILAMAAKKSSLWKKLRPEIPSRHQRHRYRLFVIRLFGFAPCGTPGGLKVDQRLVGGVAATSSDDATIMRAMFGPAPAVGIKVIAEGVETAERRAFLIAAGCQFAQGHYFQKTR